MKTNSEKFLTPKVLELFSSLVYDAKNWEGRPCFDGSKGALTNLKKADLLRTEQDEENKSVHWINFTAKGVSFAKSIDSDAAEIIRERLLFDLCGLCNYYRKHGTAEQVQNIELEIEKTKNA